MLIRRKVFSVLEDETGEERLFSTNEVAYLGDEYYDIDERMYSDDEDESNVAKYAGIGAATGLAAVGGGKLAGKAIIKHQGGNFKSALKSGVNKVSFGKLYKTSARNRKIANALQTPYDFLEKKTKSAGKELKKAYKRGVKKTWKKAGVAGKAGMVLVPAAAVAATGYGAKKAYDNYAD